METKECPPFYLNIKGTRPAENCLCFYTHIYIKLVSSASRKQPHPTEMSEIFFHGNEEISSLEGKYKIYIKSPWRPPFPEFTSRENTSSSIAQHLSRLIRRTTRNGIVNWSAVDAKWQNLRDSRQANPCNESNRKSRSAHDGWHDSYVLKIRAHFTWPNRVGITIRSPSITTRRRTLSSLQAVSLPLDDGGWITRRGDV